MATKLANGEEGSSKVKKNLDNWKFPKIPVNQIYKKKVFRIFPSYVIKDYEETITMKSTDNTVSLELLRRGILEGLVKKKHKFLHLGLVQIAIKPLIRPGLESPVIVCLRDARHLHLRESLLAIVDSNLSQGPLYFNCFPSFSVSLNDASSFKVLTLTVNSSGIPLALTFRLVCKAMVDLRAEHLKEPMLGETTYFQANSGTGTPNTTKWDGWTLKNDPEACNKPE